MRIHIIGEKNRFLKGALTAFLHCTYVHIPILWFKSALIQIYGDFIQNLFRNFFLELYSSSGKKDINALKKATMFGEPNCE